MTSDTNFFPWLLNATGPVEATGVPQSRQPASMADRQQDAMPPAGGESARVFVRTAEESDFSITASLHSRHLNHGFLPGLGKLFLRSWHRETSHSRFGVGLVAVDSENQVLGFLLGSTDQVKLVADLVSTRKRRLLPPAALGLLLSPSTTLRFLRTRLPRYARRLLRPHGASGSATSSVARSAASAPAAQVAVVAAIVVDPLAQRRGVGRSLMHAFLDQAARSGGDHASLLTLDGAAGAGPFYKSLDWTYVGSQRDGEGVCMREYRFNLSIDGARSS